MFCAFAAALLMVSATYSWLYERAIFSELFGIRIERAGGGRGRVLAARHAVRWAPAARDRGGVDAGDDPQYSRPRAQWTGGQLSPQYDRVSLVILATAVLMTWSATWALLASAAVIATYVAQSAVFGGLGSAPFTANLVRMLGASAVTVAASVVRERRRWRELWSLHALTEARRHADEEIRRLDEEFEQRVLDRTAELRASEERARAMFEAARTHQGHLAHVLRVTSMGGMVAELAHELNQPLGAIV